MKRNVLLGLSLAVIVGCQGLRCRHRDDCNQPCAVRAPQGPIPVTQGMVQPPVFPPGSAPGGVPAGAPGFAAPTNPQGSPSFPTAPAGPAVQGFNPPANGNSNFPTAPQQAPPVPQFPQPGAAAPQNNPSGVQPVEARTVVPLQERVLLSPPVPIETDEPKSGDRKFYPPTNDKNNPPQPRPEAPFPVGIPQYAAVKEGVAAGLRPAGTEGVDWLKSKSYRTVVHLRLPGEKDDADREAIEKLGMKFVSMEVSPNLLTRESVDEFLRIVRDRESQPTFIYDRDGALAGGLWYLWYRLGEGISEDAARIRARGLGLREDREGAHRDMWQSAQRYLNDLQR